MQYFFRQWWMGLTIGLVMLPLFATPCEPFSPEADTRFYQRFLHAPVSPMAKRLAWISEQFLGAPYRLFILGDGPDAELDQCPLYRLDAFDCETFVTTVLALALSHSHMGYQQCLRAIRYHDGQVGFLTRHHFTSIEWNVDNQRQDRLRDITKSVVNPQGQPVFQWSTTWINKAGWIQHLSDSRVRLRQDDPAAKARQLKQLQQAVKHMPKVQAKLPYIPLTALFDAKKRPNQALFDQIPDGAIIEIVRPNWALEDKIGTNLDVSHLGFAFRARGKLLFRNASSQKQQVIDEPLIAYLRQALASPTIKGINIQVVAVARC